MAFSLTLSSSVEGGESQRSCLIQLVPFMGSLFCNESWSIVTARGRNRWFLGRGAIAGGPEVPLDLSTFGFTDEPSFFASLSFVTKTFFSILLELPTEFNDELLPPERALLSTSSDCFPEMKKIMIIKLR